MPQRISRPLLAAFLLLGAALPSAWACEEHLLSARRMQAARVAGPLGWLLAAGPFPHRVIVFEHPGVRAEEFFQAPLEAFSRSRGARMWLKRRVFFSPVMVRELRRRLVAEAVPAGEATGEAGLFRLLGHHTLNEPNLYNLTITRGRTLLAPTGTRTRPADYLLGKHVFSTNHDPDTFFGGVVWFTRDGLLHLAPNSGTYQPNEEELAAAEAYLRAILPNTPLKVHAYVGPR